MIITRKVRLTSPILASRPPNGPEARRTFDRYKPASEEPLPDGSLPPVRIKSYLERWNWAFLEARDALDLDDVSVATILPAPYFEAKKTSTYNRTQSGSRERESFECVPSGYVLEWRFTLSQHLPPHAEDHPKFHRPPTEKEFDDMLAHIGANLGMSFWGHAHLFGLFELHNPPQGDPTPTPKENVKT